MTMTFDYSRWPIVTVTQRGETGDKAFASYLGEMDSLRRRESKFLLVLDLRSGEPFTFAQRSQQNKWIKEHPEHLKRLVGIAFVESSWMMRGAMKASFFALPPTYPFVVTGQIDEAYAWARAQLAAIRPSLYPSGHLGA